MPSTSRLAEPRFMIALCKANGGAFLRGVVRVFQPATRDSQEDLVGPREFDSVRSGGEAELA